MTNYTKTMMESLAEVRGLQEDNMDLMRKAAKGAMQTIKFKDGKLQMDSFTASGIMGVYDKVNTKNKKAIENIINSGTKAQIMKLQDLAMKAVKSGYGEEVELDEGQEKGPKQLTNPNKEVMVVKKSKVVVIDKKDQDKYLKQGWTLAEEVELDEKWTSSPSTISEKDFDSLKKGDTVIIEYKSAMSSGTGTFKVTAKNVVGKAKVEKVTLQSTKNPKAVKHFLYKRDDKVSFAQGDMAAAVVSFKKEEVDLDEAKYDLYHKDFSTAMQHAYKMAKKMYGITVDDKEIDDKVASGPKKPSEGKTNKYRLKGDKGAIQIQVYNKGGSKPFELNMYKEEVELDEGYEKTVLLALKDEGIKGHFSDGVLYVDKREIKDAKDAIKAAGHIKAAPKIVGEAWEIGTDEYRAYLEKLTPGETNEVEEASARADAMRHMRGGSKVDPADVDTDASDEDIKAASKHIIMQLRKAISLKGNFKVEFGDKKKIKIPVKIAQAVIQKYNSIKKPAEKEKFQTKVAKSHRDMLMVLKAGYNESTDTVLGRIDKKLKERKNG